MYWIPRRGIPLRHVKGFDTMSDTVADTAADAPIEVYGFKFSSADMAAWPQSSMLALVTRGLRHLLGNEVAATVSMAKAKGLAANPPAPMSDDDVAKLTNESRAAKMVAIAEGTLFRGRAAGAPRATPIEAVMNKIILDDIAIKLKSAGKTLPTGDKTVVLPNGEQYTRAQLVARAIARRGEEHWRGLATKEIVRREREVGKVKAAGELDL